MTFSCVVRVCYYVGSSQSMQAMDSCFCALGKVVVETVHVSSVMRCEECIDCLYQWPVRARTNYTIHHCWNTSGGALFIHVTVQTSG